MELTAWRLTSRRGEEQRASWTDGLRDRRKECIRGDVQHAHLRHARTCTHSNTQTHARARAYKHTHAHERRRAAAIFFTAQQIIKDNGFEGQITLLHGKCEEIELPVDKVWFCVSVCLCLSPSLSLSHSLFLSLSFSPTRSVSFSWLPVFKDWLSSSVSRSRLI